MALYRKHTDTTSSGTTENGGAAPKNERPSGLGRGFSSLSSDNAPGEKKPLVVRRGAYEPKTPRVTPNERSLTPKKTQEAVGVGGKLVIRTDTLPQKPVRSARSARKGTTVLVRTERNDPQKRYHVTERTSEDPNDYRYRKPIVIDPRKKK